MQAAQEQLQQKNQELVDLYREKSKKLAEMTKLYNLLKSRAMQSQMQTAASDTVSRALNTMASRGRPSVPITPSGPSRVSTVQTARPPQSPSFHMSPEGIEQLHRYQRSGTGSSRQGGKKRTADAAAMPPPTSHLAFSGQKCMSFPKDRIQGITS